MKLAISALSLVVLALFVTTLTGCWQTESSTSSGAPVYTPTPSQQNEAAQLRKELPKLEEVNQVKEVLATAKKEGKKLSPEQIDILLNKIDGLENRLDSIEGNLNHMESGGGDHDGHDHDHDDHDHDH